LKKETEIHPEFLSKCLKAGRCLVLLDALDEVGNDQRSELHSLIVSHFATTHPNNKVCITSRERGFIPKANITCFYITPIVTNHVDEYVTNFIELGKFNADEKQRFIEQSSYLVDKGFVKGFLTLSLLMAIYKNEHELPTNKVLLYEKCFEYIASTREKKKNLMLNSSTGEEYDWKALAKLMNDATFMELTQLGAPNNADVSVDAIFDMMMKMHERRFDSETECKMAIDMFLQFCADRTEIFVPSSSSNLDFRFYHRSFYEYFFAKHIEIHTTKISDTLDVLCSFDVDSEIFELLVALYERRNPYYLRDLVNHIFEKVEVYFDKAIDDNFSKMFGILVLIMQVVDDNEFYGRFVSLILDKSQRRPEFPLSIEFGQIVKVLNRHERQYFELLNQKREEKEYIDIMRTQLAKSLIHRRGYISSLSKKSSITVDTSNESLFAQTGFKYYWLLWAFSASEATVEEFEDYFDTFSDPKKVLFVKGLSKNARKDLVGLASKVKALPYKKRKSIYVALLNQETL
jgi:hypothetical protein